MEVLRDVKKISRSHRHNRRMKVFAIESSLWHRERGFQGAQVTNSVGTRHTARSVVRKFQVPHPKGEDEGIHLRRRGATLPTA